MPENWIYRRGDIYLAKHGEVYSLQGILSRANEEQIYISRYLIVTAIKSGDLIARKVGKTYLIQGGQSSGNTKPHESVG